MTPPVNPASLPLLETPFGGPLDLLLDEVRRQNVAIEAIAIAPLAARFLDYIDSAPTRQLNLDMEWLHMAATLILWKSRALLAGHPDTAAAGDDPIRDELVEKLKAHGRELGGELARRQALARAQFSREERPDAPLIPESLEPPFVSVGDLLDQARELALWARQRRESRQSWRAAFGPEDAGPTAEDRIEDWRRRLAAAEGRLEVVEVLRQQPAVDRPFQFLALLEVARQDGIHLEQAECFGPAWLHFGADCAR